MSQSSNAPSGSRRVFSRFLPFLIASGVLGGIIWTQIRIGGARPVYAIPGYTLIGVCGLLSLAGVRIERMPPNLWCVISASIFFAYLIARTLSSPIEYLARTNLYLILAALIVYFLTATQLTGVRPRLLVIGGLLALEIGDLWVGARQFSQGENYLPFGYVRPDYGARASGFYVCPNHLAGFLEIVALMTLSLALFARIRGWLRLPMFYLGGAAVVGILITGSRGGYLSIGAGLVGLIIFSLIYFLRLVARRFTLPILLGGAAVAIGIIAMSYFAGGNNLVSNRLGSIVDPKNMRVLLWHSAVKQFESSPVFGTGSGTFLIYGRKFRDPFVQNDPIYTHNDYLQLLAEYGLTGEILFFVFLLAHLGAGVAFTRKIMERLKRREESASSSLALAVGATLAVCALMVHSVVDFNLQIPANTLVVAFFFGVLANSGVRWSRQAEKGDRGIGALPALLALPLLILATPKWLAERDAEEARIALEHGIYARSLGFAKAGVEKDPLNPELFYYLGESRRQLGSRAEGEVGRNLLESAAGSFEKGLALFPMDERLLVKGALSYAQLGDFPKADQLFQQAFQWSPNLGQIYAYYGLLLQMEHRYGEAREAYEKSNQLESNQVAIIGLEQTLKESGSEPRAEK
jgi:O-antigen ligase